MTFLDSESMWTLTNPCNLSRFTYTERGVALYALGVGAGGADPCNPSELPFVYHPDGQFSFKVLPTFTVLYPFNFVESMRVVPGLHYDLNLLLHGEQYIEIYQAIPTKATMRNRVRISGLHDNGEPSMVQSVQGRFLLHVFPGAALITEMWKDEGQNRVDYKLKVREREKVLLAGSITLRPTLSRL